MTPTAPAADADAAPSRPLPQGQLRPVLQAAADAVEGDPLRVWCAEVEGDPGLRLLGVGEWSIGYRSSSDWWSTQTVLRYFAGDATATLWGQLCAGAPVSAEVVAAAAVELRSYCDWVSAG